MARKKREPEDNTVPMDMTPMIDCIFLLLIFFILTSKFTPDEKAIASLLPTNKGQTGVSSSKELPKQVNICIYPMGMAKGRQPSEYWAHVQQIQAQDPIISKAALRIGGSPEVEMDRHVLGDRGSDAMNAMMDNIHAYVAQCLEERDKDMPTQNRKDAVPVVISCYSGMSWQYALLAYDAVRAYEASKGSIATDPNALENAREVTFAPPRIRNYDTKYPLGNELYEIVNMR